MTIEVAAEHSAIEVDAKIMREKRMFEARCAFIAAFAAAQGEFAPIVKNREVQIRTDKGTYTFRYADLEEILSRTRPALASNNLSISSSIEPDERGVVWLSAELEHASGYAKVSRLSVDTGGDIKQVGGRITYLRRYMIAALLGVAADDDADEDGREAGDGRGGDAPSAPSAAPKARPARKEPPGKAEPGQFDGKDASAKPAQPAQPAQPTQPAQGAQPTQTALKEPEGLFPPEDPESPAAQPAAQAKPEPKAEPVKAEPKVEQAAAPNPDTGEIPDGDGEVADVGSRRFLYNRTTGRGNDIFDRLHSELGYINVKRGTDKDPFQGMTESQFNRAVDKWLK